MIYLTYGDPPSGVYSSQVSDVVRFLDAAWPRVRLVAFVSVRGFLKSRRRLRSEVPGALVFPMLPKINYWRPSAVCFGLLCRLLGERRVIARGVLACNVALASRRAGGIRTLCYDGRGAIAAEWAEYDVAPYKNLNRDMPRLERKAVLEADFRISVSQPLVDYWRAQYDYRADRHVIIPCLLNSGFAPPAPADAEGARRNLGYGPDDIVLVYSGSVSGWQSFRLVSDFLTPLLKNDPRIKVLFLSGADPHIDALTRDFPSQVSRQWVAHEDVPRTLAAGDYGLLLREPKTTNLVAAPTKFAEYLSAGLPVLISEGIGDYTAFVRKHGCGTVIDGDVPFAPAPAGPELRRKCIELAAAYFTKESARDRYRTMAEAMGHAKPGVRA